MKIKSFAKKAVCVALLAGASFGANAVAPAPTDLGPISIGIPETFSSVVENGAFTKTFIFTLPANGGSGYNLIDIPLNISGLNFQTVFATMGLTYAGANGAVGGGDDVFIKGTPYVGDLSKLTLQILPSDPTFSTAAAGGTFFLDVFGRGEGASGGIFSGSISVLAPPVPEPESYAMFLAGLGLMGVIVRRRMRGQS